MTNTPYIELYLNKLLSDDSYLDEHELLDNKVRSEFIKSLKEKFPDSLSSVGDDEIENILRTYALNQILNDKIISKEDFLEWLKSYFNKKEDDNIPYIEELYYLLFGIISKDKKMIKTLKSFNIETTLQSEELALDKLRSRENLKKNLKDKKPRNKSVDS